MWTLLLQRTFINLNISLLSTSTIVSPIIVSLAEPHSCLFCQKIFKIFCMIFKISRAPRLLCIFNCFEFPAFFPVSDLESALSDRDAALRSIELELLQLKEQNQLLKQESQNQVTLLKYYVIMEIKLFDRFR